MERKNVRLRLTREMRTPAYDPAARPSARGEVLGPRRMQALRWIAGHSGAADSLALVRPLSEHLRCDRATVPYVLGALFEEGYIVFRPALSLTAKGRAVLEAPDRPRREEPRKVYERKKPAIVRHPLEVRRLLARLLARHGPSSAKTLARLCAGAVGIARVKEALRHDWFRFDARTRAYVVTAFAKAEYLDRAAAAEAGC